MCILHVFQNVSETSKQLLSKKIETTPKAVASFSLWSYISLSTRT